MAQAPNLQTALEMMQLDGCLVDESWSRTPAAKRPRLATQVEEALRNTPPPVVGRQSETCFVEKGCLYYLKIVFLLLLDRHVAYIPEKNCIVVYFQFFNLGQSHQKVCGQGVLVLLLMIRSMRNVPCSRATI